VEVLLAASRKANVEDRVAAAQAAGLKALVWMWNRMPPRPHLK